jgi:formylmethanofuran dehydrogenase subunit E
MSEWTIGPGECERCQAYVAQLERGIEGGQWLCDECAETAEENGEFAD